jgi:large subunit ribosomal protein L18
MNSNSLKRKNRVRYKIKLRNKGARLRLSVFRSNNHFYAQIIDDVNSVTLVSASTLDKEFKSEVGKVKFKEAVLKVASFLSARAKEKNISEVVFDKGSYAYHGNVKNFAEECRNLKVLQF